MAIQKLPATADYDRSVVTVTKVEASRNLRTAMVSVSVRQHEIFGERALADLRRSRSLLQSRVNSVLTLKYTPRLHFRLDKGIASGDRVLEVLQHLDIPRANDVPDHEES